MALVMSVRGVCPYYAINIEAKVRSYLLYDEWERESVCTWCASPQYPKQKEQKCALWFRGYQRISHDILHGTLPDANVGCSLHIFIYIL